MCDIILQSNNAIMKKDEVIKQQSGHYARDPRSNLVNTSVHLSGMSSFKGHEVRIVIKIHPREKRITKKGLKSNSAKSLKSDSPELPISFSWSKNSGTVNGVGGIRSPLS